MDDVTDGPATSTALARALVEWMLPDTESRAATSHTVPDSRPDAAGTRATPWDRASALARLGGDETFLAQILAAFQSDMAMRVAVLGKAIAANDPTSAHLHAVSVQLAAAKLGADALEEAARRLDQAVVAGNHATARRHLRRLTETVDQLAAAVGMPPATAGPALAKPGARRRRAR